MSVVTELSPVGDDVHLGELGEHAILEHILRPRYGGVRGFGDDCAVLDAEEGLLGELVATTDSCPTPLVTSLGETDPYHAGWLLATINLSDLAAAGATPLGLVVNYTLPKTTTAGEFRRLLDGVDDCAKTHGTKVVGGDLRDGPVRQLTATAIGRCVPGGRLGRAGAAAGDRLLLVGSPGYLWAYALLVEEQARLPEAIVAGIRERAFRPMAQVAAGKALAAAGLARAAMDVSDGLFPTVRTLCGANGLGARIRTDIHLDNAPAEVCAQAGLGRFELAQAWGDWTLVVAVRPEDVELARKVLTEEGVAAQEIGILAPREEGISLDDGEKTEPWNGIAQERFSPSSWHGGDLPKLITEVLGRRAS
ncbi:thiamine-monophosphate kinase [Amycolatopsis thailandensis]|uniref:Thiamine-monophosphate kinase n=1 Tax=Amycolatopsis thailandensis TaxID=589330 RepID=A0A229RRI2_9PSEU|nr:thiamine-phosphate kinase [Amycolatopsis thailandensis]OXM49125.1 thiamine-monophosphate kinase [Amycolatopsis thailandensis]